jgi:phosphopantothenate-cysteine ligase/phosphopantothenoylcysteine decarboxylase/phosphopantothenate--cysteine ligase
MNILVTAGNTYVPIDQVRGITNIFTGRTGSQIATHAYEFGHHVTLLTSHPELVESVADTRWTVQAYRTFDDLQQLMEQSLASGGFDALIHCAAVSDYQPAGVYAPAPHTHFVTTDCHWESRGARPPALVDRSAAKVKSSAPELWLRLVRTAKLVDRVRSDWRFAGVLVKFKLEAGVSEEELHDVAERSRLQSSADLMVANTLEGMQTWAILGHAQGGYERVSRADLPSRLLAAVERVHKERSHG